MISRRPAATFLATATLGAILLSPADAARRPKLQPAATTPSVPEMGPLPPEGPLRIVVVEATGIARYRTAQDQNWQNIAVGQEFPEGVEINTGPKSFVKLMVGETQQLTFDRLGRYTINRATVQSGIVRTEAVMREGRTRFEVESAGREHDAVIRSPTSTLGIRGTVTELYDQPPFTPQAVSYTGRVEFRNAQRLVRMGSRAGRTVRFNADKDSPAQTALSETIVDPTIGGYARTPSEQRLIEQVIATGGVIGFDVPGGIPVVRGGTPLQFDTDSEFPGAGLNFVLNWTGDANLNLTVALPAFADIITPITSLNRGMTGGVTTFDHRGGNQGGFEVVFFPVNYPGSDCVNPAGGLITFPGPPVNGKPSIIIPDIDGVPQQQNTAFYISSIDFLSGNVADVALQTFARDPQTGKMILVSEATGSVNGSIKDVGKSQFVFRQVNPAPCLPSPSDAAMATLAASVTSGGKIKPPPAPKMDTDNCGCDIHTQPAKITKSPTKKKKK